MRIIVNPNMLNSPRSFAFGKIQPLEEYILDSSYILWQLRSPEFSRSNNKELQLMIIILLEIEEAIALDLMVKIKDISLNIIKIDV